MKTYYTECFQNRCLQVSCRRNKIYCFDLYRVYSCFFTYIGVSSCYESLCCLFSAYNPGNELRTKETVVPLKNEMVRTEGLYKVLYPRRRWSSTLKFFQRNLKVDVYKEVKDRILNRRYQKYFYICTIQSLSSCTEYFSN